MSGTHPSQLSSTVTPNDEKNENLTKEKVLQLLTEDIDMSKYTFLNTSVDEIKISSVAQLLQDYKRLAIQNESLKKILSHSQKPFSPLESTKVLSRLDIAKSSDRLGLTMDEFDACELYNAPKRSRTKSTKHVTWKFGLLQF